jgi:Uma2 family endonuclease
MTVIVPPSMKALPDHTQLPDADGAIVQNFQEHPQSILLTDAIRPVLDRLHPDGRYCIGQDSGIYWDIRDPPLRGCVAPDWFCVEDVPPTLDGQPRRSYVMWQELRAPLIVLEFVSGDGTEERDRTPGEGKFWIYERRIRPGYYVIYEVDPGRIEMYQLRGDHFETLAANERSHFPVVELGIELGLWQGTYLGADLPWMRWYDALGVLLPTWEEKAKRMAARLRELGEDPDVV